MTEELKGPLFGSKQYMILTEDDAQRIVQILSDHRIDLEGIDQVHHWEDFIKRLYKTGLAIAIKMEKKDSNVGKRARLLGIIEPWPGPKED